MSVRTEPELLPPLAGLLVVLFLNVLVGEIAGATGATIAGNTQILVWIGTLLAGVLTTWALQ